MAKKVRYECDDLLWDGLCRDFTPSYDVESPRQYAARVSKCEKLQDDPEAFEAAGCKRIAHVYLPGGRSAQRYENVDYPKQAGKGGPSRNQPDEGESGKPISRKTLRRLDQREPPLSTRTQSEEVRAKMPQPAGLKGLADKIRSGLLRFSKEAGSPDLLVVPNSVYPLVNAGVPYAAAEILVERAAGSRWITEDLRFQLTPLQAILARTGELVIRRSNIEDAPGRLGILRRVGVQTPRGMKTVFLKEEFSADYDAHVQRVRRQTGLFDQTEDSPENRAYVGDVLDRLSAKMEELRSSDGEIQLFFSLAKQPLVIRLSDGEHSMFSGTGAEERSFDYRSLAGSLPFSRLPEVLARLVQRNKPKRQRTLARMNPMMQTDNLKTILSAPGAQPIAVPGKPGRVYVYSKKRDAVIETSAKRAAAWAIIAKTAAENKEQQSADAKAAAAELGIAKTTSTALVQENPMYEDDAYFLEQYSQSPYGAQQAIPVARRNPRRKAASESQVRSRAVGAAVLKRAMEIINSGECNLGSALKQAWDETHGHSNPRRRKAKKPLTEKQKAAQAHARVVLKRAHEIYASKGCSVKAAVDKAWSEIRPRAAEIAAAAPMPRRGRRSAARNNPVDYRDPSVIYSALDVPIKYQDPTQVITALSNSSIQYTTKGQPYKMVDGRPRFISKAQAAEETKAARMNPAGAPMGRGSDYSDYSEHHPIYEQWIGQFSTSEPFTAGFQPMNRRNPAMTARFPSKCANCGGKIQRGEHIQDSGKRGPKGGKLMAHVNCGY